MGLHRQGLRTSLFQTFTAVHSQLQNYFKGNKALQATYCILLLLLGSCCAEEGPWLSARENVSLMFLETLTLSRHDSK